MSSPASTHLRSWAPLSFFAATLAALALAAGPSARADLLQPALNIGPVSVADGTATLSGSLGGNPSTARLSVNGQPVGVAADGTFTATVNLGGQSELTLTVVNPTGAVTTRIPLTTNVIGPGGVIPPTVLDALEKAAISLTRPVDGFTILDGLPLTVTGSVADRSQLAALTLNGVDLLKALRPDGTYAQTIPGSSERVTVSATDTAGVSQTTTYEIRHTSSVISTPAGASIAAAGADGVRIAGVRYQLKGVKKTKRVRMTVTVKDRRGRLVRDTIVRVRVANFQVRRKYVRGGQQAKLSTRLGRATFVLRVTRKAFGRRVFTVAVAKTPNASAKRTTSMRLPRMKAKARTRR